MPAKETDNDQNKSEDRKEGNAGGPDNQKHKGTIEIVLGDGKRKTYADLDELKNDYLKLAGRATEADKLEKEQGRLRQIEKTARAAMLTNTPDSEREFYEALDLPDKEIEKLLRDRDDFQGPDELDDDDDSDDVDADDRRSQSKRNGDRKVRFRDLDERDMDQLAAEVLRRSKGRLSHKMFDDETRDILRELADRSDSSAASIREQAKEGIKSRVFAKDKIVGQYWERLSERQRDTAMNHVLKMVGSSVLKGRIPSSEEITSIRDGMRSYLADVYGQVDELRKRGGLGIPPSADPEETTGFEDVPDEELEKELVKASNLETPTGRGSAALATRMNAAFEMARRSREGGF